MREMDILPIGDRWFSRERIDDAVWLLTERYTEPTVRCNIWFVRGRDRDLVVDTGLGVVSLRQELSDLAGADVLAVATHGHFDHVGGLFEFSERAGHLADTGTEAGLTRSPLVASGYPGTMRDVLQAAGYPLSEVLVTARPFEGFEPASFTQTSPTLTRLLDEGDVIDLGDRAFEVLHLPGHSPGSIGLWDEQAGVLFSGDAVYDGGLIDELPGSDIEAYVATMNRLRSLPVEVVHGGHEPSFGQARMLELIDDYLRRRSRVAP